MAGVYNMDIPGSTGLANAHADGFCGPPAPAIASGNPRTAADLVHATAETRARKRQKKVDNASVTDAELSQSIIRETAVAAELAAGAYGIAGAPLWAAQLTANVATISATVAQIDARLRLGTARRRNLRNHGTRGGGATPPFHQLFKVHANLGPPLPGRAAQNPVAAPVGSIYPVGIAPATRDDLNNMTLGQISRLAEWANDNFGIVAGDGIATSRNKLLDHYLYE